MQYLLIPGKPVPKSWGKVRSYNKPLVFTTQKTIEFEKHVRICANKVRLRRMHGELATVMIFYTNSPGDTDNFAKSVHDALNGVAYDDDAQVKDHIASKLSCPRGQERTEFVVMELEEFRKLVDVGEIISLARAREGGLNEQVGEGC